MNLQFNNLRFFRITPAGTSYFWFEEKGKARFGYTEVADASVKRSFCAVIYTGTHLQGYTIFLRPLHEIAHGVTRLTTNRHGVMM